MIGWAVVGVSHLRFPISRHARWIPGLTRRAYHTLHTCAICVVAGAARRLELSLVIPHVTLLLTPIAVQPHCFTPLHVAAYGGHASIVALLLATSGVDPLARTIVRDPASNAKGVSVALNGSPFLH